MVLASAVLDIHHWIGLLALIVAGRGVDHQGAPRFFHLTIIIYGAHFTVWHILYLKVVHTLLGDLDGTRPAAAAVECLAGRVGYRYAVDYQGIVVEPWHLRFGGY